VPVRDDARVGRNLAVGEALHGALVIVVHVGEAHSSVGLCGHQSQLLVRAAFASDECPVDLQKGPSGSLSERTIAARRLCSQDHAVL
jgi:hypothetical protein